jgi:hypothetical protein
MDPVTKFESTFKSVLSFLPPDLSDSFSVATRELAEEVITSILVSPVAETLRLRGQLEVLLLLLNVSNPDLDVIRETVTAITTAEEN